MVLVFVKICEFNKNRQIQLLSILFLIMIIIITNQNLEKYKTEFKQRFGFTVWGVSVFIFYGG